MLVMVGVRTEAHILFSEAIGGIGSESHCLLGQLKRILDISDSVRPMLTLYTSYIIVSNNSPDNIFSESLLFIVESYCLQESMKWFRADDFSWNGIRQPYRVIERHPHLVRIDPHLQVICYQRLCHPTWWPDYHNDRVNHASPPPGAKPLDWRNDVFAYHFTGKSTATPTEFQTPQLLFNATGLYADIGKMILEAADMVKYFQ